MHRRTASKRIVTDGRVLGEIEQLQQTLRQARTSELVNSQGLASEVPRLERRLQELLVKAADESLELVFEALPAEEFDDLIRRHPPTAEQLDQYRLQAKAFPWVDVPEMNPKTMAPELLYASLREPKWSKEEVADFWRGLSRGGQTQLWELVRTLQIEGSDLPNLPGAIGTTNGGAVPSTMPASGESPSPNS